MDSNSTRPESFPRVREFPDLPTLPPFQNTHLLSPGLQRSIDVPVPVIGILGGIGSGKSSVAREVTRFRLLFIDADRIGHTLLNREDIAEKIRRTFGNSVFSEDGTVNRAALAEQVFGQTAKHHSSLTSLNQIIHPAIHLETRKQILTAPQDVDAIIWDAALLLEAGWAHDCDALIFVDTPLAIRQKRVAENRGWSSEELARREANQLPVDQKRSAAKYIIDNSGSLADAARQMTDVLDSILKSFRK
ncbi:MAG: dephospho-CoA kinase [Planctomycetaceae bacterium]|nr:dephospho-CoA kinase [Planctomycetaceae bacterium]